MRSRKPQFAARALAGTMLITGLCGTSARAQCSASNLSRLGITPLPELAFNAYKSYPGGLYPNYANNRPPAHFAAGMMIATNQIRPLSASGSPTNTGSIVLLSIGMSNTTMEWASLGTGNFKDIADP